MKAKLNAIPADYVTKLNAKYKAEGARPSDKAVRMDKGVRTTFSELKSLSAGIARKAREGRKVET